MGRGQSYSGYGGGAPSYSGYGGGDPSWHQIPILRVVFPSPHADLSHQIIQLGGSTIKPGGLTDFGKKESKDGSQSLLQIVYEINHIRPAGDK